MLSLLLFPLLTHDCTTRHRSNVFLKFAEDTNVVGLISNRDEAKYRIEVSHSAKWCSDNNLSRNLEKTKKIVADFRKAHNQCAPLIIEGAAIERSSSTKFWLCKSQRTSSGPKTQPPQSAAIGKETAESPGQDQHTQGQFHPPPCQEVQLPPYFAPAPSCAICTLKSLDSDPPAPKTKQKPKKKVTEFN